MLTCVAVVKRIRSSECWEGLDAAVGIKRWPCSPCATSTLPRAQDRNSVVWIRNLSFSGSRFSSSQEVENVAEFVNDEMANFTDAVKADGVKGQRWKDVLFAY